MTETQKADVLLLERLQAFLKDALANIGEAISFTEEREHKYAAKKASEAYAAVFKLETQVDAMLNELTNPDLLCFSRL